MKHMTTLLVILFLFLSSACSSEKQEQEISTKKLSEETVAPLYDNFLAGEEGIKNTIRGYNQAVISLNMKLGKFPLIKKYASGSQIHRVISFAMEARTKEAVMRSKLSELYFKNISSTADAATVWTEEKWHYDYVDFTGKLVQPVKEMNYALKYGLTRFEKGWQVSSVDELLPPSVKDSDPPRALYD